jgi:ketosteroid isomerase-like protein
VRAATLLLLMMFLVPGANAAEDLTALAQQVRDAENAFAKSMADREVDAFAALIAPDAVFFGEKVLRGKDAVVAGWQAFFTGPTAPFSWKSESVEVLATGHLAHSSGPVFDAKGNRVGTFNSVWQRDSDGTWHVVFDKGCDACRCK